MNMSCAGMNLMSGKMTLVHDLALLSCNWHEALMNYGLYDCDPGVSPAQKCSLDWIPV